MELRGSPGARLDSFQWESELVIYFGGEAKPVMEAGYRILVTYSDILGNRYLQYFPMTFDGQDDVLKCTVNNSINRIGIP